MQAVSPPEELAFVRAKLEGRAHAFKSNMRGEALNGVDGVPTEMFDGEVDHNGEVSWKLLPSVLTASEITALEDEFTITFPSLFRAYLQTASHLFTQFHSREHSHQIMSPPMPANNPLGPLRELILAWKPLTHAGYVPFATWGDGWGPLCFDFETAGTSSKSPPIVWIEHERLLGLGPQHVQERHKVQPLAQHLYRSYRDFLEDTY